jgi:hypothetical protein
MKSRGLTESMSRHPLFPQPASEKGLLEAVVLTFRAAIPLCRNSALPLGKVDWAGSVLPQTVVETFLVGAAFSAFQPSSLARRRIDESVFVRRLISGTPFQPLSRATSHSIVAVRSS